MDRDPSEASRQITQGPAAPRPVPSWTRPRFEVVSLACELSAYAPDDGGPLF